MEQGGCSPSTACLEQMPVAGALVGPPWSKRENGFIFTETQVDGVSLYYEPHCDYQEDTFRDVPSVDAVVTPVVDQLLVAYPLVSVQAPKAHCRKEAVCSFQPSQDLMTAQNPMHKT